MSRRDCKQKKIEAFDVRKRCEITAYNAEKAKPTAQTEEAFRRKPYYLRGSKNEQKEHKEADAECKTEGM